MAGGVRRAVVAAAVQAVLVHATGCGRVAFDASPDAATSAVDALDASSCPAGYMFVAPTCYRAVLDAVPEPIWVDAEAACEADGLGAHLAVVEDAAEGERINSLVTGAMADFYVGATDLLAEGTYRTVTDQPMTFLAWGPGEPDGGTSDCLVLDTTGLLLDSTCDNPNDYVCEYDGIAAVPSAWGQ